jgi:hypothetical protein
MRYKIYSLIAGIAAFLTSCEDIMDEKHDNPDAFTDTKIEYLFSQGAVYAIENDYADTYNYVFRLLANYTQTAARSSGDSRSDLYLIQDDKGRWENYYIKRMSPLVEIDHIYASLNTSKQEQYRIYVEASKVLKAYNTAITTDFFGDMPYSEAFTARNPIYEEGAVNFKPKYDTQKEIYYAILNDLKTAADYLKTAQTNATFSRQDVIYNGDTDGWYRFANSLRVRYALRISNADEQKAKEVLSSVNENELITENSKNAVIKIQSSAYGDSRFWRAMQESHFSGSSFCYAPELMVSKLKEADDPRLPVLFQPNSDQNGQVLTNANKDFSGYPAAAYNAVDITKNYATNSLEYGIYNTITFRDNYKLPIGIGITSAETYFSLAEAAARNLYAGNPQELYDKGVIRSIQNYYEYYKNSDASTTKNVTVTGTDVSDAALSTWLSGSTFKYDTSKALEQIATQKWIHFNIVQAYEGWAEYRRTDLPVLIDDRQEPNSVLLNKANAPVRFLYPAKEASMNTENYNKQSENNKTNARLWWDVKAPN